MLLFVASEAEYYARVAGASEFGGGIIGGVAGGVVQAYATMGFCTCMKTVEITKHKVAAAGQKAPGTWATFMDIYRREGIRGINKGVNAVAIRQMTNWGSRFGLSRLAEQGIRKVTGKEQGEKLNAYEKILASTLGGGLSAWNQPIEVIRVEMQSKKDDPNRPKKMTVGNTFKYIYETNGIKGLYRGVAPRIGLGVWQTVCMVALGDMYVSTFFLLLTIVTCFADPRIGRRPMSRSSRVRRLRLSIKWRRSVAQYGLKGYEFNLRSGHTGCGFQSPVSFILRWADRKAPSTLGFLNTGRTERRRFRTEKYRPFLFRVTTSDPRHALFRRVRM